MHEFVIRLLNAIALRSSYKLTKAALKRKKEKPPLEMDEMNWMDRLVGAFIIKGNANDILQSTHPAGVSMKGGPLGRFSSLKTAKPRPIVGGSAP